MDPGPYLPPKLPLRLARSGTRWLRIHANQRSAIWFGPAVGSPPVNRFDDPLGKFRVCYLGTTMEVCFAETFLRNPPVRILAFDDLAQHSVATVEVKHDLRIVPLLGANLARLGTTTALASSAGYHISQAWSRALWEHPGAPDGLAYRSRHDDSAVCIALYHRAKGSIAVVENRRLTDDSRMLAEILRRYNVGLTR